MLNLLIFFIFLSKKVIKHYNKRNLFRYFVRNKNQKKLTNKTANDSCRQDHKNET